MAATKNFSLEVERLIEASRDQVYTAWTDPAQMKQWLGPENVQTRDLIADARAGGTFRWDLTKSEGVELTRRGAYRELQLGKKIGFTWHWAEGEDWEIHVRLVPGASG